MIKTQLQHTVKRRYTNRITHLFFSALQLLQCQNMVFGILPRLKLQSHCVAASSSSRSIQHLLGVYVQVSHMFQV